MPTRVVVSVLPLLLLAACGADARTPQAASPTPVAEQEAASSAFDIALEFDAPVVPGDVVPGVTNDGTAEVRASVVTAGGGEMTWTPDRGAGWAVRMPAARDEGPVQAAAIVIRPTEEALEDLDPGGRDILLQVDFRADPPAASRARDDGDNLLQWGRYGDPAQVKLQLDHGRPSCRVEGTKGEVFVAPKLTVEPDHWYRMGCSVAGGRVRLELIDLEPVDPDGDPVSRWVERTDPGDLVFGRTPLSVGAKVGASGRLDRGSVDQFNGVIDRVVVDVG